MAGLTTLLNSIEKRNQDLFAIELVELEIVFSLPSLKQAKQYQFLLESSESESERMIVYEHIFSCYVKDKAIGLHNNTMPAGIPESIAKVILYLSGAGKNSVQYTEQMFLAFRQMNNQNTDHMKRIICNVFGGYTFESLDKLTYQQLVSNFIQAEQLMIEQGIIEKPFSFEQVEKEKSKKRSIEELMRADAQAHQSFEGPKADGNERMKQQQMMKLREDAKKRAAAEEANYRRAHS